MQQNWPWFSTLIDLLEMILVKSEIRVAENYDRQLVCVSDELATYEKSCVEWVILLLSLLIACVVFAGLLAVEMNHQNSWGGSFVKKCARLKKLFLRYLGMNICNNTMK